MTLCILALSLLWKPPKHHNYTEIFHNILQYFLELFFSVLAHFHMKQTSRDSNETIIKIRGKWLLCLLRWYKIYLKKKSKSVPFIALYPQVKAVNDFIALLLLHSLLLFFSSNIASCWTASMHTLSATCSLRARADFVQAEARPTWFSQPANYRRSAGSRMLVKGDK